VRAITSYAIEPVENPQVRVAPRGMRLGPGGGTLVAYQVTLALELAATAARGGLPQTTPADAIVQCSWDSVCNVQGLFLRASVPVPLTQNRRTLRVLNANSWNYNHWPQRQPLIERELLRWAPDVVLLQELRVRHTGGDRAPQAAQLAAAFARTSRGPVHWYYTATVQFGEHGYDLSEEGVGIMSRFPVLRHGFLPLSSQGSFNADGLPRRVVWLTLLTPQGEVTVSTVHLTLTAQARARHYKEIGAWVKRMRGGGPGAADGGPNTTATEAEQQDAAGGYDDLTGPPVLLGGDFNEELHTLSPHPFLSRAFRDTATDALDAGAVGAPPESPLTFPAWEPVKRIDHIFAHGARARGVFAAVTGGADGVPPQWRHAQDHYPSDHLFNVADVDVEPVEDEK
jgi:endonuclease/exonuclease/phosphatase family metal-dependent hydrolase